MRRYSLSARGGEQTHVSFSVVWFSWVFLGVFELWSKGRAASRGSQIVLLLLGFIPGPFFFLGSLLVPKASTAPASPAALRWASIPRWAKALVWIVALPLMPHPPAPPTKPAEQVGVITDPNWHPPLAVPTVELPTAGSKASAPPPPEAAPVPPSAKEIARARREEEKTRVAAEKALTEFKRQRRITYAKMVEERFLDGGMDVRVEAVGKQEDTLRFTWILANRVTVHDMHKRLDFDDLRTWGFRRVELTDGYDSSWHWDLSK